MNQRATTIVLVLVTVLLVGILAYFYGMGNSSQDPQPATRQEQVDHEDIEEIEEGQVESCSTNTDCSSSEFCAKTSCSDTAGTCTLRPEVCVTVISPVCGCNNSTYQNSCKAFQSGVNVGTTGDCSFL